MFSFSYENLLNKKLYNYERKSVGCQHKNPFPAGWAGSYDSRSSTTFDLNFGRKALKIKNKKPLG
jgi:hypothetical protein